MLHWRSLLSDLRCRVGEIFRTTVDVFFFFFNLSQTITIKHRCFELLCYSIIHYVYRTAQDFCRDARTYLYTQLTNKYSSSATTVSRHLHVLMIITVIKDLEDTLLYIPPR